MINRIFSLAIIALLLFAGTSLGSYDLSAGTKAENLTLERLGALGVGENMELALANASAPQTPASSAGTELAVYSNQAPPEQDLGELISTDILQSPPSFIYYYGSYLDWTDFVSTVPRTSAGMWIERSAGWSWYGTLPLRSWAREMLYVPMASPVTLYEIYPSGSVSAYNLGLVQAGYYYIWFYADVPGRHRTLFTTNNGYSNTVVIDVYSVPTPYRPVRPSQRELCEQNPQCSWANNHCYCRGIIDDPKKLECEQNPQCDYVNGNCYCRGLIDDEREKCEQNPLCSYVDGQCLCTGENPEPEPGPVPNPVAECEQNPLCHWANGQCLCTGFNPEPQPEPEPEPEPGPVPNPVAECEQNPLCHWVNGQCLCTGAGVDAGIGAEEDSEDLGTTGTTGLNDSA